jgi:serine/threonine protein kinase
VGRVVLDRYVLVKPLDRGGVSLVFEAVDVHRMRPVAVKMLAPAFARNVRTCHAARQEPLIMQLLRHPSVPKVYAFGEASLVGTAMPCLAMELLDGVPLARRLAAGRLPWPEAVEIAAMAAEMLAVAHRRGIAHRDLTPGNVMLTSAGVKIIDFGLATAIGAPMTERETAQDVYALGVLLYKMLTGQSPYASAAHDAGFANARVVRLAPTPVLAGLGVPRFVAELCRHCMAKRPADRPGSSAVALALWSTLIAR